ncbi:MAG: hypothetical protein RL509_2097 [Pseudomonadota bacterium]
MLPESLVQSEIGILFGDEPFIVLFYERTLPPLPLASF